MPELRQNRFTKEWVIFATERARRPHELARRQEPKQPPHYVATCPFCLGNEQQTPPEIVRVSGPEGHWQIRVVPNKYAAHTAIQAASQVANTVRVFNRDTTS